MNSKKGIGVIFGMFAATIAIALILIGFIIISGLVKIAGGNEGVGVVSEREIGLGDVYSYAGDFSLLVNMRYLVANGEKIKSALSTEEANG